ncbi:putative GDP-fucose protein O-fucosyltransferase 2 [Sesbania bispinosa]|nr:putative GDP-fucose protein O-fucosyltransferase 2 [Sesbania bispinosa]
MKGKNYVALCFNFPTNIPTNITVQRRKKVWCVVEGSEDGEVERKRNDDVCGG